jgi:hypothetical protein
MAILNPFLVGRQVLVIENHDLAPVLTAVPGNEVTSEAAEAVFVGNHNGAVISCTHSFQ